MASDVEQILRDTIDGKPTSIVPDNDVEELLVELKESIEKGGGSDEYVKKTDGHVRWCDLGSTVE